MQEITHGNQTDFYFTVFSDEVFLITIEMLFVSMSLNELGDLVVECIDSVVGW